MWADRNLFHNLQMGKCDGEKRETAYDSVPNCRGILYFNKGGLPEDQSESHATRGEAVVAHSFNPVPGLWETEADAADHWEFKATLG